MVDITHKSNTLREATAQAVVKVGDLDTIFAIQNKTVPKGDVMEMSRAAGLLAIKKTPEILPDCHPIPIEYAGFSFEIIDLEIIIRCTIKTIYKTGVEVEAMHGASVVALNMYDMLKPIDKNIEINTIKLLNKTGGKSSLPKITEEITAAVIVCSDSISNGINADKSGKSIIEKLTNWKIKTVEYAIIPDEIEAIQSKVKAFAAKEIPLIIFTGGTGLSPRDQTPEALKPLLDKTIPGIEETIRNYGQNRTQFAMLSRSVAGLIGKSLVLALPGSEKGAKESLDAIFPTVMHVFEVIKGNKH